MKYGKLNRSPKWLVNFFRSIERKRKWMEFTTIRNKLPASPACLVLGSSRKPRKSRSPTDGSTGQVLWRIRVSWCEHLEIDTPPKNTSKKKPTGSSSLALLAAEEMEAIRGLCVTIHNYLDEYTQQRSSWQARFCRWPLFWGFLGSIPALIFNTRFNSKKKE